MVLVVVAEVEMEEKNENGEGEREVEEEGGDQCWGLSRGQWEGNVPGIGREPPGVDKSL